MKTETNQTPVLVKVANRLLKDQQELDHLAVQFSLGKAEALKEFEKAKAKFKIELREFKSNLQSKLQEEDELLILAVDELIIELDKSTTETKEMFQKNKEILLEKMSNILGRIENNPGVMQSAELLRGILTKSKLELEIIEKNINEGRKELTNEYHEKMAEIKTKIDSLITELKSANHESKQRLDHFKLEIQNSYDHLKKAIKSL